MERKSRTTREVLKAAQKQTERRQVVNPGDEAIYVDTSRNISVSLGCKDLRGDLLEKGRATSDPLSHNPTVYYRQAKHFAAKMDYRNTLLYLSLALDANEEENDKNITTRVLSTQALCLAKLGDFDLSQKSAEAVLRLDPTCTEAIWIKAESLYNNCDFEHAMAVFSRGLRISPGFDGFITGIAKCRKTIQNTLYKEDAFNFPGSTLLLEKLRVDIENDPDTVDKMLDDAIKIEVPEDDSDHSTKVFQKGAWMNAATKSMINKSDDVKSCLTQIKTVGKKKNKLVDRLKDDKKYLKKLEDAFSGNQDNDVNLAVYGAARDTLKFLDSRQKFWNQAKSKPT